MNAQSSECVICGELTTLCAEPAKGHIIFVCHDCIEKAKTHFIFICMSCGTVHMKAKERMISRMDRSGLKDAYIACRDLQIIQGIEFCVDCCPEKILEYKYGKGYYGNSDMGGTTH